MSAIWGAIDFNGGDIPEEHKQIFRDAFAKCVIDRTEEISDRGVYMGCGIQYITPEAKLEKLPCRNGEDFFTGDVILDNRDEVFEALGMKPDATMPDGEIVRLAFERLGQDSLNLLLGAYVFVKYDSVKKKVEIVGDAVGNRYVLYCQQGSVLYFSSLMEPLTKIIRNPKICEAWFAAYLGLYGLNMFMDCEKEPIEGVLRTEPASYNYFEQDLIMHKSIYWNPEKPVKRKKEGDDDFYRDKFLELYRKCVKDVLRSDGETGIFLSGGYDSTSVACLAAPILKERGKKLYSFTSVPLKDYVSDLDDYYLTDESGVVRNTADYLGNVETTFIDMKDIDIWEERRHFADIIEMPYKSISNMIWLYEGFKQSAAKGAKIILSGSFGNGTVSFDNYNQYMLELLRRLKLKDYWKQINLLHEEYHGSRKHLLKYTAWCLFNKNVPNRMDGRTVSSFARDELLTKYGIGMFEKKEERRFKKSYNHHDAYHRLFLGRDNFRHYGEFDLRESLYTGVILRDPTRDKRMVDFVLSAPAECFSKGIESRRLIYTYMRDIMPTGFFEKKYQGRQSSDLKYRLLLKKESVMASLKQIPDQYRDSRIIDVAKVENFLKNNSLEDMDNGELFLCFSTLMALEYEKTYQT